MVRSRKDGKMRKESETGRKRLNKRERLKRVMDGESDEEGGREHG